MQGWFINTRRGEVRRSADAAGDRPRLRLRVVEPNLFFGSYARLDVLFEKSDFAASGPPSAGGTGAARAVPRPAAGGGVRRAVRAAEDRRLGPRPRRCCSRPSDLLAAAGWKQIGDDARRRGRRAVRGRVPDRRRGLRARPVALRREPEGARHRRHRSARSTRRNTRRGRTTSTSTSCMAAFSFAATPLDGLQQFFGSTAADTPGSYNYAGIKEPAVDALLAKLPAVADARRTDRRITRAIDRVLRARHYWMPNWYLANHRRRPLGHLRLAGSRSPTTPSRRRRRGGSTATRRRRSAWPDRSADGRLYPPPHPADHPDDDRDHGDQLRRRAVRAGRAGRAGHRAAAGHRRFGDGAHHRRRRRFRRRRRPGQRRRRRRSPRNIAARRGSTRNSSRSSKSSSASTSRRSSASA